jgi:hypothetical protein
MIRRREMLVLNTAIYTEMVCFDIKAMLITQNAENSNTRQNVEEFRSKREFPSSALVEE